MGKSLHLLSILGYTRLLSRRWEGILYTSKWRNGIFISSAKMKLFSLSLSLVPNDLCWRTKIDEISFHHPLTFFRGALCSFSIQPMRLPCIFPTKKKLTDKNDVDDDCHDSRGLLMKKLKKKKPEVGDCVHIHFSIQSVY
jgi:hypothetical protein